MDTEAGAAMEDTAATVVGEATADPGVASAATGRPGDPIEFRRHRVFSGFRVLSFPHFCSKLNSLKNAFSVLKAFHDQQSV